MRAEQSSPYSLNWPQLHTFSYILFSYDDCDDDTVANCCGRHTPVRRCVSIIHTPSAPLSYVFWACLQITVTKCLSKHDWLIARTFRTIIYITNCRAMQSSWLIVMCHESRSNKSKFELCDGWHIGHVRNDERLEVKNQFSAGLARKFVM